LGESADPRRNDNKLLLFNGFLKESQGFSFLGLFFLPHELHGLAAAVQRSLSGNDHLHLVPADFTDVELPDFISHSIHLPKIENWNNGMLE
jgi:hypothetical protein